MMHPESKLQFRSIINRPSAKVFGWHLRPRMLERVIPPWEKISILHSEGRPNRIGSKLVIKSRFLALFTTTIELEYAEYEQDERFLVRALSGILKDYAYETTVNSQGLNPENAYASEVIDRFKFSLKVPFFIKAYLLSSIKKRIARILKYKHDMIERDIDMMDKYPFEKPLKILISGAHGLIGKNLGYFLEFMGHDVWHLSRGMGDNEKTVYWNPKTGECNPRNFEGFDTVIHLAGENIGKGRWTEMKKERILKSRTEGTEALTNVIKGLKSPPKTFISASAIGYYGDCGSAVVDESSDPGKRLFITEVCERWERASKELEEKGIRVVQTRFGMVLSSEGGALKKMLTPFKLGFGGRLGNGKQYVSWVAIDDVVGALYHTIMTSSIKGAVNIVSPEPISNETLTKKLAKALNRWEGAPIPEALIRFLMGQKGEELLLTSARVCPTLLQKTHYRFQYPSIDKCFKHVIGYT